MAFNASKLTVVKIGVLSTSPTDTTDISTYCSSATFSEELDEIETTTFGNTNRQFIAGFADATLSLEGFWDPTLDGLMTTLTSAFKAGTIVSTPVEYGPAGSTAGSVRYSGNGVLTKYEKSNDVDGVTEWTADFHISGEVTVDTW